MATMTAVEAIIKADTLRPNTIAEGMKLGWVSSIEADIAAASGEEPYAITDANKNEPLLCPVPYDECYYLYLMAMIDFAISDSEQYANDMVMANAAVERARAYIARTREAERASCPIKVM